MKILVFMLLLTVLFLAAGCNASAVGNAAASNQSVSADEAGSITPERAQSIALEHAGLTADQVTGLRTEYEVDDRIAHYEVQFRQGRWEYDYEINANTGAILSFDRDD